MPAPANLTGKQFGRMTALEVVPRNLWPTKKRAWMCRCDCGTIEIVPVDRLPHSKWIDTRRAITACRTCRSHECVICGQAYYRQKSELTCSDNCRATLEIVRDRRNAERVARGGDLHEHQLELQRNHYATNSERIQIARKQRRQDHPEIGQEYRRRKKLRSMIAVADELVKRR